MSKVLITGGSGRLGRYVTRALAEVCDVTVYDKRAPEAGLEFYEGDILDAARVQAAVDGHDVVIHLAALDLAVPAEDRDFFTVNVQGTWNLFEAARLSGVGRVVHCSSVAAVNISDFNPPRYLPVDTTHPADPRLAYGLSKLVGEQVARRFKTMTDMSVICLRPTLVMQPDIVYDVAVTAAKVDGTSLPRAASHPDWKLTGEPIRGSCAYVDPRDAASAFRAAFNATEIGWGVFNVASSDTYSELPTLELVEREFGVQPPVNDQPLFHADPRASIYDVSQTRRCLGWSPTRRWAELLDEVLASAM